MDLTEGDNAKINLVTILGRDCSNFETPILTFLLRDLFWP
jgi:hypothetical protein